MGEAHAKLKQKTGIVTFLDGGSVCSSREVAVMFGQ